MLPPDFESRESKLRPILDHTLRSDTTEVHDRYLRHKGMGGWAKSVAATWVARQVALHHRAMYPIVAWIDAGQEERPLPMLHSLARQVFGVDFSDGDEVPTLSPA